MRSFPIFVCLIVFTLIGNLRQVARADDFFATPPQQEPPLEEFIPLSGNELESAVTKMQQLWAEDRLRRERQGNANWETDFATSASNPALVEMVSKRRMSPEDYAKVVDQWASRYRHNVITEGEAIGRAGEKFLRAPEGRPEDQEAATTTTPAPESKSRRKLPPTGN